MLIIKIEAKSNGFHAFQSQSHRTECWLDGYVEVPKDLENKVMACGGYCDLVIENDVLVDIIPTEVPETPQTEKTITIDERVTALENALLELVIGGVE